MQVGFLYAGEYLDAIQPDYGQQWRALRDLYASLRDKRFSALGHRWTRHHARKWRSKHAPFALRRHGLIAGLCVGQLHLGNLAFFALAARLGGTQFVPGGKQVLLLGEFSQWQPIELKRMKNGEFKATLNLPTDGPSHFEYCYQLVQPDGETLYDNDWEADDYVPGPFGRDNSVVRVSQPG